MNIHQLKPGAHVHLMGICGTAMASLAGLLLEKGYQVTGSDLNPYPPMSTQIESLGISILKPYKKENLHPRPDFVVVGNVISANNEEAMELKKLDIPYSSLPQVMGDLIIDQRESIVIAGTHGKTTTTSLMAWVASQMNFDPGFLIGGIAKNFSQSFKLGGGRYFIIEGDEYDTAFFDKVPKFIHYRPRHVILTSIEFDHADIYKNIDDVKKAFTMLLERISPQGHLIYHDSDENIKSILKHAKCSDIKSYGFNISADYRAQVTGVGSSGVDFKVSVNNKTLGSFHIPMTGDYNVLNATAVIAMAHQLGWNTQRAQEALFAFLGVKRRQEILGEPRGILIIEDFAHHPTAVRETIKGIKDKYPQRKIWAVFEPRSATSRRKIFQKDYVQSFQLADEVLIPIAFDQSKINETDRFSSQELVSDLIATGRSAHFFSSVDEIVLHINKNAQTNDVVLIMSNGGFDGIYQKLLRTLSV